MSKIRTIARWSTWAGALSSRHRRLAARTAGLSTVLARSRAAGRTVRERWLLSSRGVLPRIQLSIQPLLRFELRPAATAPQVLRQIFHPTAETRSRETRRTIERWRQTHSATILARETALRWTAPRATPLTLVLQRLREPERGLVARVDRLTVDGPGARPPVARHLASKRRREELRATPPAVRVLRADAPESRSERALAAAFQERAADSWGGRQTAAAAAAVPMIPPAVPAASVEALTEKVMRQIDQRLHAWRERRGAF